MQGVLVYILLDPVLVRPLVRSLQIQARDYRKYRGHHKHRATTIQGSPQIQGAPQIIQGMGAYHEVRAGLRHAKRPKTLNFEP